jgi:hypothetical protein
VTKQPLLTDFPRTVFATARRRLQAALRRSRQLLLDRSLSGYAVLFESLIPPGFLAGIDTTKRQRFFGQIPVFWAWLAQIFEANASCSKALGLIQSWHQANATPAPEGDTSGYCQGRIRLGEEFLKQVCGRITGSLRQAIKPVDLWQGMVIKAIDGSSVQLMDTPENQAAYPQPSGQKPGCGFPVMGIVGVVNLSHGGWEGFETCGWRKHDARMAPRLLNHIEPDDLLLADRAFCSYEFIARLVGRGAHVLMRLHQARHRKLDWRRGTKLSPIERLVTWKKPVYQPPTSELSAKEWADLPGEMTLRYIKLGFENRAGEKRDLVVVTDLLDPIKHDAVELSCLYARRWEIEVKLRDVKTTLGMERFAVKTPEMAHKTLWMMIIAYNLMRATMQQAAQAAGLPVWHMSFKATLDLVTSSHEGFRSFAGKPRKLGLRQHKFIELCATKLLDIRPFRREPRAVKRRPKNYQLLTRPRHVFQEIPHREGYRKAA